MTATDFPADAAVATAPSRSRTNRRMALRGLAFVAPAALLLIAIYILPMIVLAAFSVTDYQLGALSINFVGLQNFIAAMDDDVFLRALTNTVLYAAIVIPLGVFLALGVALLVYNRKRSRAFWEVAYFLPVTATLVAMATVWQFLLHPSIGPVNAAIKFFRLRARGLPVEPGAVDPDHGHDRDLAGARLQHGAVPRRADRDP